VLQCQRRNLPTDDTAFASTFDLLGQVLLARKQYGKAEATLRESLRIRERNSPVDWQIFITKSVLGECLFRQGRFEGVEGFLLSSYEGLHRQNDTIPLPDQMELPRAAGRLAKFYDAEGQAEQAKAWAVIQATMYRPPEPAASLTIGEPQGGSETSSPSNQPGLLSNPPPPKTARW